MPKQPQPIPETTTEELPEPLTVGELTLAEAREIKALTGLIMHYDREVARLTDDLARAKQTLQVVTNQRVQYARGVVAEHGIDVEAGSFTLDEEQGVIIQTSRRVPADRPALAALDS
jgi:hypothetical protein